MMDNLGYITVQMSQEAMAEFYAEPWKNSCGCLTNQYVLVADEQGNVVDKVKWNGSRFEKVVAKKVNNGFTGKISPRNIQQELAFDMLSDPKTTIKILTGKFGTGKDFVMITHALDLVLRQQKFDKIIWVRNNIEVKNSAPIGFLPGSLQDKLLPYAMIMADHVGGLDSLDLLIKQDRIELQHLGLIRGRDIKNSIIICSEAENMTKEHVQLLIGRVGENSALWLNGDQRQVDKQVFENNNGLMTAIRKLSGHELFAHVHLEKTERSATAAMADLLD